MTSPCVHLSSPPQRNVTDPDACHDLTLKEAHAVLELLNTTYVDLLLLHGPSAPSFGTRARAPPRPRRSTRRSGAHTPIS